MNSKLKFLVIIISITLYNCSVKYSLTGASISPETKTFQVNYFQNNSTLIEPGIDRDFTNKLIDLLINQTSLDLVKSNGDLLYEGEIVEYRIAPTTATANNTAAQNRLTIGVNVRFYDKSDPDAEYDKVVIINAEDLAPFVTWGTNPGMVAKITDSVPNPDSFELESQQLAGQKALEYMQLNAGTPITDIPLDRVFIGSCTNSRIEDLRAAAEVVKGYKVSETVNAMVVPGSFKVKEKAEKEGLDRIFKESGFEWRDAGCSMCLGMNPDILSPGERCASTSNRNFEGRQGPGGLTHLVSPQMAAAAAIQGTFVDIRDWSFR